jgi:phage pi2 protein 07
MGIDTQNQLTLTTDTAILVNDQEVTRSVQLDLLSDMVITGTTMPLLLINNVEILPKLQHLLEWENGWLLYIPQPFYVWYFYATFQGFIA